jgi:TetR/AcrR family transcriptional repressor of nem operon
MNTSSTYEDILDCARNCIVAGGYNGFSYADIADVVGIRKPSIHHHFPNKVDLVQTLVRRYRKEAQDAVVRLERTVSDPLTQLRAYTDHWEACISDSSLPFCVCAVLAAELPLLPPTVAIEVKEHFEGLSHWLAGVFERGAEQGLLRLHVSARADAELFMATVHGAMLSARAHGKPHVFKTVMSSLMQIITNPN